MRQVIPQSISKDKSRKKKVKTKYKSFHSGKPFKKKERNNVQKYGTSQLERDFARDFLDKNDIVYIYQFEAKEIKRFYDFAILPDRIFH